MGRPIQISKFLLLIVAIIAGSLSYFSLALAKTAAENSEPKSGNQPQPDLTGLKKLDGEAMFAQVCAACHGADGQGNADLKSPSIAGMPSYYSLSQLEKFRKGTRGANPKNLPAVQMRAIALAIDPENLDKVAKHIQKMDKFPTVSKVGGDPKKGKPEYAERCMACHRFNGTGEVVFGSPPLISLPDWYLLEQLQHFRDDRRGATEGDEGGQKMREATDGLSDEMLKNIVAYIGELAAGREPKGSVWR